MNRTFNNAAGNLRKWGLATMIAATSIAIAPGTFAQVESGPAVAAAQPNSEANAASVAEMQSRIELINGMLSRFEVDAAAASSAGFNAADWRRDFAARLVTRSASELQAVASAPNLAGAESELFSAMQKPSAKHTFNTNLKVNLFANPCRIVYTVFGAGGGQLGPAWRLWQAQAPAATIAAQGGNAAGCGQRVGVEGWVMVITVVPSPSYTSPSFLTVQHDNFPTPPTSANLNYVNQNTANLAFAASQDTSSTIGGFYAYASSFTHVVIDLLGYASHVDAADLDCVKTYVENLAVPANATFNMAIPGCPTGYSMTGAGCRTPGFHDADWAINGLFSIGVGGPVLGYCAGTNARAVAITVQGTGQCCRTAAP
jgi:hypothetical protein